MERLEAPSCTPLLAPVGPTVAALALQVLLLLAAAVVFPDVVQRQWARLRSTPTVVEPHPLLHGLAPQELLVVLDRLVASVVPQLSDAVFLARLPDWPPVRLTIWAEWDWRAVDKLWACVVETLVPRQYLPVWLVLAFLAVDTPQLGRLGRLLVGLLLVVVVVALPCLLELVLPRLGCFVRQDAVRTVRLLLWLSLSPLMALWAADVPTLVWPVHHPWGSKTPLL